MKPTLPLTALLCALAIPAAAKMGGHAGPGPMNPMKMMLEQADANGDGALTRAEVDAWRAGMFARADSDGDGGVDPQEAARFIQEMSADMVRREARVMVARFDENGDGKLGADEAAELGGGRIFDRLDRNDDGQIDAEEMKRMRKRHDHDRRD